MIEKVYLLKKLPNQRWLPAATTATPSYPAMTHCTEALTLSVGELSALRSQCSTGSCTSIMSLSLWSNNVCLAHLSVYLTIVFGFDPSSLHLLTFLLKTRSVQSGTLELCTVRLWQGLVIFVFV